MKKEKAIAILGTGIFICLILQGISFIFSKIIETSLLFIEMEPLLTYGISNYLSLIISLCFFLFIINKLKTFDYNDNHLFKRIFIYSIIGYLVTLILKFGLPFVIGIFESVQYMSLLKNYYFELGNNSAFTTLAIDTPITFIKYIVIALIVFRGINAALKEQSKPN